VNRNAADTTRTQHETLAVGDRPCTAVTAATAVETGRHPAGANRVFAPEDGAVRYRQIDNFGL
jgi:hypothetical protein